jgi:hypothetical protein
MVQLQKGVISHCQFWSFPLWFRHRQSTAFVAMGVRKRPVPFFLVQTDRRFWYKIERQKNA